MRKDSSSGEKLWNAIDKIDDKYIQEAIMYDGKEKGKYKKRFIKGITAVAAAGMILFVLGITCDDKDSISRSDIEIASKSNLIVSVMAAENEEEVLKKGSKIEVSSMVYSPFLSSVPALPFTFDYDVESKGEITIIVSTREDGNLMKYEISEDGIWNVTESGESLECKPGETLYWRKNMEDYGEKEDYGEIYVDVYEDGICIESRSMRIQNHEDKCFLSLE